MTATFEKRKQKNARSDATDDAEEEQRSTRTKELVRGHLGMKLSLCEQRYDSDDTRT